MWTGGLLTESRLCTTAPVWILKSHATLSRPYEHNIKIKFISMYYRDINVVYIQLVAAVIKTPIGSVILKRWNTRSRHGWPLVLNKAHKKSSRLTSGSSNASTGAKIINACLSGHCIDCAIRFQNSQWSGCTQPRLCELTSGPHIYRPDCLLYSFIISFTSHPLIL